MRFLIVFFFFPALFAHARWAALEDADYMVLSEKQEIFVKKDGTYVLEYEREIQILKENGRSSQGLHREVYNQTGSSLKILAAKTINKESVLDVDPSLIEISPLASSGPGFDSKNQVTIPFPDVRIGSRLYLKLRYEKTIADVPGVFYLQIPFGYNEYQQKSDIKIVFEQPFFFDIHDPEDILSIKKTKTTLSVNLKKPTYRKVQEEENVGLKGKDYAWISVSSMKDWSDFPKTVVDFYEATMDAPLPTKLSEILEEAKKFEADVDRINAVTSGIAEKLRYVGDWRPVNGGHFPRSLQEINKTGYGDCKDFSVATGAILRRMGFDAHVAWIGRGSDWLESPTKTASPRANHAIVYVKEGGREFWIDPTNPVSASHQIFEDISDRSALVLDPRGSALKHTPKMRAPEAAFEFSMDLQFQKDETIDGKGIIRLSGRAAQPFTASDLFYDKKNTDHSLLSRFLKVDKLENWSVGKYNLSSRIISPIEVNFTHTEKWTPLISNMGSGYLLPRMPWLSFFETQGKERASHLDLGYPAILKRKIKLSGKKVSLKQNLFCKEDTPWASYERRLSKQNQDMRITDTLEIKQQFISPEELRSDEFRAFQRRILSCLQEAAIIFQ